MFQNLVEPCRALSNLGMPRFGRGVEAIRLPGSTESDFKKTRKMVKKWFLDPPESMVKKWSFDGSGPPQKMCPKSGQKMVKKWSQPRPGTIKTPLKHH